MPFQSSIVYKNKATREHLLQNNHRHISGHKDFNNNADKSNPGPTKSTLARKKPKVSSVLSVDLYDHINTMKTSMKPINL